MEHIDLKIGEETNKKQSTNTLKNINEENIHYELEYLNQKIRENEYKNEKKYKSIKNILICILVCQLILIIPELITKFLEILFIINTL